MPAHTAFPDPVYTAVSERWHAALRYIRAMDQTRLADAYGLDQDERRHLQLIRTADAYDQTTRAVRQATAVGILAA